MKTKNHIYPTALEQLREFYEERKERNGSYSLSAYARDLGISTSNLSRTLNGRRPVSLKMGLQVSAALGLDENDHKKLVAAILSASSKTAKISVKLRKDLEHQISEHRPVRADRLEIDQFQSMAQWYHLAILNLARLPGFKADPVTISNRLGISSIEAQTALDRLQKLNLLSMTSGTLKRTSKSIYVKLPNSHLAVRSFHSQMIMKALAALEDGSQDKFQERHITGTTITCSQSQLEVIKEKADKFHADVIQFLEKSSTTPDSVYQLNTQLFSLTKTNKG